MERLKNLIESLPRPVQVWSLTVLVAAAYILFRLWQLGGKEAFLLFDRIVAIYSVLGIIIFLGFFMTRDP